MSEEAARSSENERNPGVKDESTRYERELAEEREMLQFLPAVTGSVTLHCGRAQVTVSLEEFDRIATAMPDGTTARQLFDAVWDLAVSTP